MENNLIEILIFEIIKNGEKLDQSYRLTISGICTGVQNLGLHLSTNFFIILLEGAA